MQEIVLYRVFFDWTNYRKLQGSTILSFGHTLVAHPNLVKTKKLLQPKTMLIFDITVSIVLLIFLFHICECAEGKAEFENAFAVLDAIKPAFPSITLGDIKRSRVSSKVQVVLEYMVAPASSVPPISDDHLNALRKAIREAYTNENSNRKAYLRNILDNICSGLKKFFEANPENRARTHFIKNTILSYGEDTQNDTEEQDLTARIQKHLERALADDYAYHLISVYMIRPVRNKVHKLPAFFSVLFGAVDENQLVIRYHLMRDVKIPAVQDHPDQYFLGMYVREDFLLWKHQQDPQLTWESTLYNELKSSAPLAVDPEEMDKAIALHSFEKLLGFLRDPLIKAILKPFADTIIRARSSSMDALSPWTALIERILTEGVVNNEHDTKLKQDFIAIKHLHGASFLKLYDLFADDALDTLQYRDGNVQPRPNFSIGEIFYCNEWPREFHVPSMPYLPIPEQFSQIDVSLYDDSIVVRTFVKPEEIADIKEGHDIDDSPPTEIRNDGSAYLLGNWIFNVNIRLSFYGKQSVMDYLQQEQPATVRFIGLNRIENKIVMPDVNEEAQNDVVEDAKDEYEQPLIAVKPIVLPTGDEKISSVDKRPQMIEIDETGREKSLTEEKEKKRSARQNRKDKSPKNSKNTHSKIALTTGVVFVILLTLFIILVARYSVTKRNEQKQDQTDSL